MNAQGNRGPADVVLVGLERQFRVQRQRVEPARALERGVDARLRHAVVHDHEEADILLGVAKLGGESVEGTGGADPA